MKCDTLLESVWGEHTDGRMQACTIQIIDRMRAAVGGKSQPQGANQPLLYQAAIIPAHPFQRPYYIIRRTTPRHARQT